MKKSLLLSGILSLILAIALLAGCAFEKPAAPAGDEEEILVTLSIREDAFTAKTIQPDDVVMKITKYKLKVWDSSSNPYADPPDLPTKETDFIPKTGDQTTIFLRLKPGVYIVRVEGYNDTQEYPIGQSDDKTETIAPTDLHSISITVYPVEGKGDLELVVQWPTINFASYGITPQVTAEITPAAGNNNPYTLAIFDIPTDATIATFKTGTGGVGAPTNSLGNGYYKCKITLVDTKGTSDDTTDDETLWSTMEALRIITSSLSKATYELVEELNGFLVTTVKDNLQNTLDIFMTVDTTPGNGAAPEPFVPPLDPDQDPLWDEYFEIGLGSSIEIVAFPQQGESSVEVNNFDWYVNGDGPFNGVNEILIPVIDTGILSQSTFNYTPVETGVYWIEVMVEKEVDEEGVTVTILSSRRVQVIVNPSTP